MDQKKSDIESLPNEWWLQLFQYISIVDLLDAFSGLNNRLDSLVQVHLQGFDDFRSISKEKFDRICRQDLPSIADRMTSMTLSEGDETPQQIELLYSCGLDLPRFSRLQSISYYGLRSDRLMKRMMDEWPALPELRELRFFECEFRWGDLNMLSIVNSIWSVPKLTNSHIDIIAPPRYVAATPNVTSTSLQCLSIQVARFPLARLIQLLRRSPELSELTVKIDDPPNEQVIPSFSHMLTTLSISSRKRIPGLLSFLQLLPNLCNLTVETADFYVDGHQWKQLIVVHLTALKQFQLKTQFQHSAEVDHHYIDHLLDSYRTTFWLEIRKWFIRVHWNASNSILLYTLPYSFAQFDANLYMQSASTSLDHFSLNKVTTVNCLSSVQEKLTSFAHIHHLALVLPVDDYSPLMFPRSFLNLGSLDLTFTNNPTADIANQFQNLLHRCPNLRRIRFFSSSLSTYSTTPNSELSIATFWELMSYESGSVRQLDLQDYFQSLNQDECVRLARSVLVRRCKVLAVPIESIECVSKLVKSLPNLRALNIQFEFERDHWIFKIDPSLSDGGDSLLKVLRAKLPRSSVTRDSKSPAAVRFWISR